MREGVLLLLFLEVVAKVGNLTFIRSVEPCPWWSGWITVAA